MNFGAMFQTWMNVLTKPGEATFEAERNTPQANLGTAVMAIVAAAFIAAIFQAIGAVTRSLVGNSMLDTLIQQAQIEELYQYAGMMSATGQSIPVMMLYSFCFYLIAAPIGFLIGSLIWFVIAKIFGGQGEFEEQTYLLSTFTAPLMIVTTLINILPILGGCIAFFIGIYQIVLTYFSLKVSHDLTSGRAIGVVVTPIVIVFLCACCSGLAFSSIIAAAAGSGGGF